MKYRVQVQEVHVVNLTIEAESAEEAREKANEMIAAQGDLDIEYSHTLDPEEWVVLDENG